MIVKTLKENEAVEYSSFLNSVPEALIYHTLPYLKHIGNELQADLEVLIVREETKQDILGALPFLFSQHGKYGRICNSSAYFGSNGGFLLRSSIGEDTKVEVMEKLYVAFEDLCEEYGVSSSTIISSPFDDNTNLWCESNASFDFKDSRIGQVTPLPEFTNQDSIEQDLIDIFSDPRPRNIRKARKSGIEVYRSTDPEDLDFLFDVHVDNISAIGGLTKRKDFFQEIPTRYSTSEYAVFIAQLNDKKVAGLLLFYFNNTVEYFTPATIHEFRNLQPSSLIILEAMKDAVRRGFKYWNWGGTWKSQTSLHSFKKKWGAVDMDYYYYTRVYDQNILEASREELGSEYSNFYVVPYDKLKHE